MSTIVVPEGWSMKSYEEHNDKLARIHGEPEIDVFSKSLEEARRHLKAADKRRDPESKCSEMHQAIEALIRVVESCKPRKVRT